MAKLKKLDDNYKVFYSPTMCGWQLVIEGARMEDCPLLFTDEWIMKINKKQREMVLSVLKAHSIK